MRLTRKLLFLGLLLSLPASAAQPYIMKPPVAVTVTTSATVIASGNGWTFADVCNMDTSKTMYLGFDAALTSSTGRPLMPGQCVEFVHLAQGQTFYAIVSAGTAQVVVTKGFDP